MAPAASCSAEPHAPCPCDAVVPPLPHAHDVVRDPAYLGLPAAQGLYDPDNERDSCGVGFVAHIRGEPSHKIVSDARMLLCNMTHRGATGSDSRDGDGAGVMVGIPHQFFVVEAERELGITLPKPGEYAVGNVFFKKDDDVLLASHKASFENIAESLNLRVLGWREVPTDGSILGPAALSREPVILQPIVVLLTSYGAGSAPSPDATFDEAYFERQLYVLRKHATHTLRLASGFYICSLSSKSLIYKGQLSPIQVYQYYFDLYVSAARLTTAHPVQQPPQVLVALCPRALEILDQHASLLGPCPADATRWPQRRDQHVQGQPQLDARARGKPQLVPLWRRTRPALPDHRGGRVRLCRVRQRAGAPHGQRRPLPPGGDDDDGPGGSHRAGDGEGEVGVLQVGRMVSLPPLWRADTGSLMEPWDGPALFAFSDGRYCGASLDRNGLRPCRWVTTTDDIIICASEVGTIFVEPHKITQKGRLHPGKMLLVDTLEGRIVDDKELKMKTSTRQPYALWIESQMLRLDDIMAKERAKGVRLAIELDASTVSTDPKLLAFGYTFEQLDLLLRPIMNDGKEALGSMGNDAVGPPVRCGPR